MRTLDTMHCNIDEKTFSWMVFLTRFFSSAVLIYTSVGCLLYYREFLYNAAAVGVPLPLSTGIGIMVVQLLLALFILLGWFARWACALAVIGFTVLCFVFFVGQINKIYVALVILLAAALLPTLLMGPGKYSLDFHSARRRAKKEFRG